MAKVNFTKNGRTTVNALITAAILSILILLGFGIGAAAFGLLNIAENAPGFGKGASGTGCSLSNDGFSDTSTITNSDQVIGMFDNKTIKNSLTSNKDFLDKIIEQSKARSINPAVLISFWGAEQSFGNTSGAFGCGIHGGLKLYPGDNKQVACGLDLVSYAIDAKKCNGADKAYCDEKTPSSADWSTPSGENVWTRLLYHYVAAERKISFDKLGYVSDSTENRIQFLNKLVPAEVQCNTGFASGGSAVDVVKTAQTELTSGNASGNGPANEADGSYKKYTGGRTEDWCADFVSWVFGQNGKEVNKSGVPAISPFFSQSPHVCFNTSGTPPCQKLSAATLQPGDVVVFDGNHHTGIVEEIKGSIIHTIEGNTSGGKVSREVGHTIPQFMFAGRW